MFYVIETGPYSEHLFVEAPFPAEEIKAALAIAGYIKRKRLVLSAAKVQWHTTLQHVYALHDIIGPWDFFEETLQRTRYYSVSHSLPANRSYYNVKDHDISKPTLYYLAKEYNKAHSCKNNFWMPLFRKYIKSITPQKR